MSTQGIKKAAGLEYFIFDAVVLLAETMVYFATFLPSAWIIYTLLLALGWTGALIGAILGFWLSCLIFMGLLIAIKRLGVGAIPLGRFLILGGKAHRWIIADRVMKALHRSPFRTLIYEVSFFRILFFRAMGAQVDSTLLLGQGVVIPDPWTLRVGSNVLIGDQVIISGHKVERGVVTLETVEIGNDVLIGARSVILPGVKIGNGAVIGASSLLTRGTLVPAGEVWAGNPAIKINPLGRHD